MIKQENEFMNCGFIVVAKKKNTSDEKTRNGISIGMISLQKLLD